MAEIFRRFDKNGDGVLSMMEIECAFTVLGVSARYADLRRFFLLTDLNRDGAIDGKELARILSA